MIENKVESAEQAEALVNTLQIEGASLRDTNLSGLSNNELVQLEDLQAELDSIDTSEIETEVHEIEIKPMLDENIVETEIGEHEVVIQDDVEVESEEILQDYKDQSEVSVIPPPLRPLTIAPKPPKVQMALKTAALVNTGAGQQIVFIQSPGNSGNTVNLGGQQIKLVPAQNQVTLQNVQLANKTGGMLQLRPVSKSSNVTQQSESITNADSQIKTVKKIIPQNKNVTKMVVGNQSGNQIVITTQANDSQPIKLVTSVSSGDLSTAKTITLAQAQQMGLLTSGKVQQLIPQSSGKQTIVLNKTLNSKSIKVVPQIKSPTKILPAPVQTQKIQTKQGLQRVIIKQGGQLKSATTVPATVTSNAVNQVIRLPATSSATGQIHQINVPGKGVQYIRLMPATTASTTTTTSSVTATASSSVTTLKIAAPQKSQVVPVAGIAVNRNKIPTSAANASQSIIKVIPISGNQTRPVVPKPITTGQRIIIPATNSQTRSGQTLTTIPATALSSFLPSGNSMSQIVMVPAQYMHQIQNQSPSTSASTSKVTVRAKSPQKQNVKISPTQAKENASASFSEAAATPGQLECNYSRSLEPNGIRPRKPCNCTKSLCLKLYCDCFANGEFCYMCNCMNCYNNLDKESERQRAIKNCLERNPNAFRPKIGKGKDAGETSIRKHTKGCNCKRSGCLKNYCECYEAKIACSSNCKCVGCRNIEDSMEKKVRPVISLPENQFQGVTTTKLKNCVPSFDATMFRPLISSAAVKTPSTYITSDVIEATSTCLLAQGDEGQQNMLSEELTKRMILEEFGRCLVQIIECSKNANDDTNTDSNT